jgi:cytochrome c-type biogenesis protein CcmE
MKPLQIALLIVSGLAVAAVVSLYGNTTRYVTFSEAFELSKSNFSREVHVVCQLDKSKPIQYNPEVDPNHLEFYAKDSLGGEAKVIFSQPKPQDLERTERIVLTGKHKGSFFYAEAILSKCPSKYEDAPVKVSQK